MFKKIIVTMVLSISILSVANAQQEDVKKAFNKALSGYFNIKNALASDNGSLAGTSAKSFLSDLKSFPTNSLTVEQRNQWKIQAEELKKHTAAIVAEKDLKVQRKSFEYVSSAVIKIVKGVNLNNNDVYVQYCPMVKRSWLNEIEDVQNPFYGSKMYECGEVTDTIAKK